MAKESVSLEQLTAQLKAVTAEVEQAGDNQAKRAELVKKVEELLGSVRVKDMPELAESPIIQQFVNLIRPADLKPGETRNKGTLAEVEREWSWKDLRDWPTKTWIPNENITLTWNGLSASLRNGDEVTLPTPFYDLWREHLRAVRNVDLHTRWMLGSRTTPPPDPSWIVEESAKVRALATGDGPETYYRGSFIPGVGSWAKEETEEKKGA